jgi:IMP dehydrogenase
MSSLGAMQGRRDRYQMEAETKEQKLVPEGIEGSAPHKGSLAAMVTQLVGGLKAGMDSGCANIQALKTKKAPNYRLE